MIKRRKGFTLVELVVVVCVLILMMTVLLPGVNKTRERAMAAVCMQNQKSLVLGWIMYAEDNEEVMVAGHTYTSWDNSEYRWVWAPGYRDADNVWHSTVTDVKPEERLNGIREGTLYPYLESVKLYHCPADKRMSENDPSTAIYRTYETTGTMNGEDVLYSDNGKCAYTKLGQVKEPSEKFVFVESAIKNQRYQSGSWMIYTGWSASLNKRVPETAGWVDPMAILHDKASTFSFADGHAEIHTWVDDFTFIFSEEGIAAWPWSGNPQQRCNTGNAGGYPSTDFSYIYRGYGGIN